MKKKIPHTFYNMLYRLNEADMYHSQWLICIKDILNECNYGNYWYDQSVLKNVNLSKNVKQFLHNKVFDDCLSQIFESPKCIN